MPIPVHAATYLAQVVIPFTSDMNNVASNSFFFGDGISPARDPELVADAIQTVLTDFYSTVPAPSTTKLEDYLSPYLDGANASIKVYDLSVAAPRVPMVRTLVLGLGVDDPLPNEVAVVLSYRSGPGTPGKGGTNDPTKRGRLFIGPLGLNTVTAFASSQPDTPVIPVFRDVLKNAAEALAGNAEDLVWLQYSRKNDALGIVTGGFIENAFDTQRRRGAPGTTRTVWTA